ncbi:hypothetical protein CMV_022482 [Castanea mollissima]|uniref:Uncharacterized protein n=1 Tax=Castanea mollissima TaxID=60419 RepID=A0A8J4QSH3_9ROSI|nr:hypothetical protein CMV_022482 [Castanea mollissima]
MDGSTELESQTISNSEVDHERFSIFAVVLLAIRLRISIWATLERILESGLILSTTYKGHVGLSVAVADND